METSFKDTFKELLTDLFDTHPSVDTLFLTCDGQAFFQQAHADGHASRLPNKVVEEVDRYEHFAETVSKAIEPVEPVTEPVEPVTKPVAEGYLGTASITEGATEQVEHTITQKDLNANPDLVTEGVQTGDVVTISASDDTNSDGPKSKLQIALDTPEADRTPAQKTLITKAAKAAQNKEGN